MVNHLQVERRAYPYEIGGVLQPAPHWQSEFVVDGVGLGERFSFERARPWFGQTSFEIGPEYALLELSAFKALVPPENELESGRLVLYRCHCGCDLCGVISCEVQRKGGRVYWRDVRREEDLEPDEMDAEDSEIDPVVIPELVFDAPQYDQVLDAYLASLVPPTPGG